MSRQILFIGLSSSAAGEQTIEAMYELQKSDRHNFKEFFSVVRDCHYDFVITTTEDAKNIPSNNYNDGAFGRTWMMKDIVRRLNCREGRADIPGVA